jgi:hypothetical protein
MLGNKSVNPTYSAGDRLSIPNTPYFYDEGYSADIELQQETTQEQILNLFASQEVGTTELEVRSS